MPNSGNNPNKDHTKSENIFEIHRAPNKIRMLKSKENSRLTLPDEELYITISGSTNLSTRNLTPQPKLHSSFSKPNTASQFATRNARFDKYNDSEFYISHIHLEERKTCTKFKDLISPKAPDKLSTRYPSPEISKMSETIKAQHNCLENSFDNDNCDAFRRSGKIIRFKDKKQLFTRQRRHEIFRPSPINAKICHSAKIKKTHRNTREIIPQTRAMSSEPKIRYFRRLVVSGTMKEYAPRIHSLINRTNLTVKKVLAVVPSPTANDQVTFQFKSFTSP